MKISFIIGSMDLNCVLMKHFFETFLLKGAKAKKTGPIISLLLRRLRTTTTKLRRYINKPACRPDCPIILKCAWRRIFVTRPDTTLTVRNAFHGVLSHHRLRLSAMSARAPGEMNSVAFK
ncbi:hypothetical protein AAKU55_002351 [Oxalobacteraceae bacterium GrIS 1.11]